jgi:transaldolase
MKFFVDTADVAEIRDLTATGMVDGVTTNPSLVAKTGRNFFEVLQEICAVVPGPVSAEVAATDFDTMLAEGRRLADLAENIVIKVPLTPDGLKACRALRDQGVGVNVTRPKPFLRQRPVRALSRPSSDGSTTSVPRAWS